MNIGDASKRERLGRAVLHPLDYALLRPSVLPAHGNGRIPLARPQRNPLVSAHRLQGASEGRTVTSVTFMDVPMRRPFALLTAALLSATALPAQPDPALAARIK